MKLVMIKIIFEVLLVPNKRVFRIQVNYVIGPVVAEEPTLARWLSFWGRLFCFKQRR